jgi:vancomycin resistance protein YoaR
MTYVTRKIKTTSSPTIEHAVLAAAFGLAVAIILAVTVFLGFQLLHINRIYPGVSVGGVDLGGMTQSKAAAALSTELNYTEAGRIILTDQNNTWAASPGQMGLFLDPQTSAQQAYQIGRSGTLNQRLTAKFTGLRQGHEIAPSFIYDQRLAFHYLSTLASEHIDRPVIEPRLSIEGTEIIIHPGQSGRQLDINASLAAIGDLMETREDGLIPLPVVEPDPVILDVEQQAELARGILSQPLTLSMPSSEGSNLGPWTFSPEELAAMLIFQRVDDHDSSYYQVSLNYRMLNDFLIRLAPSLQKDEQNTQFIFNDDSLQLDIMEPAVVGRTLDLQKTIDTIQQAAVDLQHNIPLTFVYTKPPVTDEATGESLGITELVQVQTSYFYGSSAARIFNIALAASKMHGVLIAPGETFSTGSQLGEISEETGYKEGLIIFGDSTIEGVGGGVCQVSTTLFRTAFFAGFPITERHSHAYRVSYYEKDAGNRIDESLAGLDATVFVPVIDLKFTNDTPYWLLMETYVDEGARRLTWKFYSTKDERSVEWRTTGPINIVEAPKARYQENPDLEEGEIEQIDWEAEGADVTVNRTVRKDGEILFEDVFNTHYEPWRAIYEYGPGTEGMPPEDAEDEGED